MKRIVTLLLAAGLVLGAAAGSQAADIKAKGNWTFSWQVGDQTFAKHSGKDNFTAKQRLRTQIDVIASESLKGVLFLEMGDQNWGKSADGASLGTDGKIVKVRYSYVDWVIPQTDAKVRMGLQNFSLPGFISNNPILGGGSADGAGITISGQFTENVGASLFWLRAENDNFDDDGYLRENKFASDAMDFIGLTVPMTFDGVKVTPWAMYGIVGRDSMYNGYDSDKDEYKFLSQAQRMLPIGTTGDINAASLDRHGNAWWVGVASELTYFDPFRFALDAAYGSVDMGSYKTAGGKNFDAQRGSRLFSVNTRWTTSPLAFCSGMLPVMIATSTTAPNVCLLLKALGLFLLTASMIISVVFPAICSACPTMAPWACTCRRRISPSWKT